MDFKVNMPGDEDDRLRQAFRTRVPGFNALFDSGKQYPVKDISATGFALEDKGKTFVEGQEHVIKLLLNKKVFLGDVHCKIMRVLDNGIVGTSFLGLDRRQQIKLDKLVLEVQKRLIQLRKAKQDEEDD